MSLTAIRPNVSPLPVAEREKEESTGIVRVSNQGTGKQPNFLQKLFDFLALDPHPYPDIMYWAADSKQLVIARPDDLAREVLPRLFKHDKVSSFGRQLNIYGFARVYPGRQFKDAQGNILDASVWAHPTLHRLSTADEIASIKRRAAPKLFRTRRLANGQVVRTRAGPDVERKFHEIKEDMANERRSKHGWGEPSRSSPGHDRRAPSQPLGTGWMNRGHSLTSPSSDDWARMGTPLIPVDELTTGYSHCPPSFDPHQDRNSYGYPLASISEDIPPSLDSLYTPRQSLLTHQEGYYNSQDPLNPLDIPNNSTSFPPISARFYRSCPASIHTSPLQAHKVLDAVRSFPPSFAISSHQLYTPYEPKSNQIQQPTRIAAPAAINPFSHHPSSLAPPSLSPITSYSLSADITPPEGLSREGSVYPEMQSWERTGIIDPRWVSPRGSAWTTPAVTPRAGSPVNGCGRGQTPSGVQMFPTSYGRRAGGISVSGGEGGRMDPPPIPSSTPTSG